MTQVQAQAPIPEIQETIVKVGMPLPIDIPPASRDQVEAALRSVHDPELMLNIVDLGLIYDIRLESNGDAFILMTLTSPACPIAGDMLKMAANAVASVVGIGVATVELTFDPPWTIDCLSEEIKILMGL